MSKDAKGTATKKADEVQDVKTKSKGLGSLLNKEATQGEKLAGVLKVFGECELLRTDLKRQTVVNKVSKAGLKIREMSNEEIDKNEEIGKAKEIISKNFPSIKTCMTDKDEEFTEDMQTAYDILLIFGRKEKVDNVPDTMSFT